jgi:threonine synthase
VQHNLQNRTQRSAEAWKNLFQTRMTGAPGPDGSGVWRYREWVLPHIPEQHLVTLGEGASPLVRTTRLNNTWGLDMLIKQCGHTHSGSFKDLGMTALVSQVNHMKLSGQPIEAIVCASTGDTSAALAAYGAAAGIRTVVLLPKNKISVAQAVQPLAHGARVVSIDTDFDGCMKHVQALAQEGSVYLANSKNSLRIEGQKTVAYEMAQGLQWNTPDWVVIPGGNLGNVSALYKGFYELKEAGLVSHIPRILCAQAAHAAPLYQAYKEGFTRYTPVTAQPTQASAIRIGAPVSWDKAVTALKACNGMVAAVSEQELTATAQEADAHGLYVCPHTAVALAAVKQQLSTGVFKPHTQVVVVSTAHGLKFTEFKSATTQDSVPHAHTGHTCSPIEVKDVYEEVKNAVLG